MAMIDYGAIVWKNGKLISTDMFTPMKDMVGWDDSNLDIKKPLVNNYFAYIGDKDFTLAFYKSTMQIYNPAFPYDDYIIFFGSERFEKWKRWGLCTYAGNKDIEIIVKPKRFHNYYVCYMTYDNNKYKVAFGHGVDLEYYKKWRIVDCYGTPWYRAMSAYRNFKYWLEELKWRWGR